MNFGGTRSHSGHRSEGTCRSRSGGSRCRCHHCMVRGRDEGGRKGGGMGEKRSGEMKGEENERKGVEIRNEREGGMGEDEG